MPESTLPDEPSRYPVAITLPVQWGDQDLYGHVNNTVYFRWFESSRVAYLERIGVNALMEQRRIGPILASVCCNFRRQLRYPDEVQVAARVTRLGRTSYRMEHAIFSTAQNALVADGDSTIVLFDYNTHQPTPLTDDVRRAIERVEGRAV